MNQSDPDKMTPFDRVISSRRLQLLKLLIPYTPTKNQPLLAIYTKLLELQSTIQFFRTSSKDLHTQAFQKTVSTPFDMLEELRPYLPESEQAQMDSLLNMFNLMEMMSMMQHMEGNEEGFSDSDALHPFDLMKGMLNPEQQELFEMYRDIVQENEQTNMNNAESKDS